MILKTFDNGWGPEWELKKIESQLVTSYLTPLVYSQQRCAVINSTWYTNEYHAQVLEQLKLMNVDTVVLVAMLDSAIPDPSWFSNVTQQVLCVGYYPGEHYIDYWAVVVEKFYNVNSIEVNNSSLIDIPYMCLNRKPHWHRRQLYNQLLSLNIVEQGIVSMGGDETYPPQRILDDGCSGTNIAPNFGTQQHGMANDIVTLGNIKNWQRHFINVVTETVFDINKHGFVSEKIFKPIVGLRPFLVYDSDGADNWLTSRGFKTFVDDFKDISDLDLRQPHNSPEFLKVLCQQTPQYFQTKYLELYEKILYNKQQFIWYVKDQYNKINQGVKCQI